MIAAPQSDSSGRALVASNSLADLAARIRQEHDAACLAMKRGLEHAMAAGKLLIEAKAQLKHGEWLPWLRDHVQIPERTAQRYMAIAPYAVIKSDNLADLTGDAVEALTPPPRPPDQAETWEERFAWAQQRLDGPFCDLDFEGVFEDRRNWLQSKLMHQANIPAIASWCFHMAEWTEDGRPPMRLCPWDELLETAKILAPIAKNKRFFQFDCGSMYQTQNAIVMVQLQSIFMIGGVLKEIEYRETIDEERYAREWEEIHTHVMGRLEEKLAALRSPERPDTQ